MVQDLIVQYCDPAHLKRRANNTRTVANGVEPTMGVFGEMAFGSTAFGDTGDVEEQDRQSLWNFISYELRVAGGRHPLQSRLLGRYLRLMVTRPLPTELQTYLADLFENKLQPRRGRRKSQDISGRDAMIKALYPLLLQDCQNRQPQGDTKGNRKHRHGGKHEDPPHVMAAKRLVTEVDRQGYPMISWRGVHNVLSS